MKPSIEKIVFNVRGKKIELSKEEAQELKGILSDLFGETRVVHEYHSWPYHHWTWPYYSGGTGITYSGATITGASISNATSDTLYLNVG